MSDTIVYLKNVYERYELEIKTEQATLHETFESLKDVSLSVGRGECVAVVGPNGAGKSTLLRLIAGLLAPVKGDIRVDGRVGSLLDLGAGFHPEMTGRDNLLLNASLYSFKREELNLKFDQILKFADIGKFIDVPVRCYSQGMYVRLAFSLAIHVDPDILLIDDCLAVGDDDFRLKSLDKVLELKALNKTIICVTHDPELAAKVCERGVYLREGRLIKDAPVGETVAAYFSPAQVDRSKYVHLGAKLEQEDARRNEEIEREKVAIALHRQEDETLWRQQLESRLKAEEDNFHQQAEQRHKVDEARWYQEVQDRLRLEEEARHREAEQRLETEQKLWASEALERRSREEAAWQAETNARRQAEEERYRSELYDRRQRSDEEWLKTAFEHRQKMLRAYLEARKQRPEYFLQGKSGFRLGISAGQIRLFYKDQELSRREGLRTRFTRYGADVCSSEAMWRLRVDPGREILCFLRWPRVRGLFQVWRFSVQPDGELGFEVLMRHEDRVLITNERMECILRTNCPVGVPVPGTRPNSFVLSGSPRIRFESHVQDQQTHCVHDLNDAWCHYFLTVRDPQVFLDGDRTYFKGSFVSEGSPVIPGRTLSVAQVISSDRLSLEFADGRGHVLWDGQRLTTGMGLYTSIFSSGIWYDSAQAIWKICSAGPRGFKVRGVWPWIPVAQTWEITLAGGSIEVDIRMQVYRPFPAKMRETVLMLSESYVRWQAANASAEFLEQFTGDDSFRMCPWAGPADGNCAVTVASAKDPALCFASSAMPDHRIVIENAAHVDQVRSRLLHCLCLHERETVYAPGEINFFSGSVSVVVENRLI